MSAYEKKSVSGGSSDIGPELESKQNGTAPLQNTSSADKGADNNPNNQEISENNTTQTTDTQSNTSQPATPAQGAVDSAPSQENAGEKDASSNKQEEAKRKAEEYSKKIEQLQADIDKVKAEKHDAIDKNHNDAVAKLAELLGLPKGTKPKREDVTPDK